MEAFLIHLLKSAGLIMLFYGYYRFVLHNQSIKHNRFFLIFGLVSAIILPFLYFTQKITIFTTPETANYEIYSGVLPENNPNAINLRDSFPFLLLIIYVTGVLFFFLKFLGQLYSVWKIYNQGEKHIKNSLIFIETKEKINPFSFFKGIFINPQKHSPEELTFIYKHEIAHAKQWHSIDIVIAQLSCIFLWFTPFSWLYKKEISKNLEYLADSDVAKTISNTKAYQKTLLKLSTGFAPQLSNHFYQSFIKKRIIMLNQQSQPVKKWKLFLILPILCTFLYSFNRKTEVVYATSTTSNSQQKQQSDSTFSDLIIVPKIKANTPIIIVEEKDKSDSTKIITKQTITKHRKIQYYVNGEAKPDNFDMEEINQEDIASINIYKDKETLKKRNASEYDAIIEIKTKAFSEKKNKNTENSLPTKHSKTVKFISQDEKPLFVVNGKIISEKELKSIDPKFIEKLNVFKGDNATRKYGIKGSNGVVEIYTKQESQIIVFTITANTTDAALQSNFKMLKDDFGILAEIKRIKRNDSKKIKAIKIKAKKEGNNSWKNSYSASDSNQIDDFYLIYNKAKHKFTMTSEKPKSQK